MDDTLQVERWCIIELAFPFVASKADSEDSFDLGQFVFTRGIRTKMTPVYLDQQGTCRVRFMPDEEGEWSYEFLPADADSRSPRSRDSFPTLRGRFQCLAPGPGNHGPVHVVNTTHFAYADGTPYYPFGSTCLEWYRGGSFEQTLETLGASPFNKIRFSVTPVVDAWNELEEGIRRLMDQGIEAELLLDCGDGGPEAFPFLRNVIARLGAYRNVWWTLIIRCDGNAAEEKVRKEALVLTVQDYDAFRHLLTFHTNDPSIDLSSRAITHVSLQCGDPSQVSLYTELHQKPVVLEECGCEGNSPSLWESLPPEELMNRIWIAVCRGGHAGHGEMFMSSPTCKNTWHIQGNVLMGASSPRIGFLREIREAAPPGMRYMPEYYDAPTLGLDGVYYLQYCGIHRFPYKQLRLPEGRYTVEVIDAWNMTIHQLPGEYEEEIQVTLPSAMFQALRIRRVYSSSKPLPIQLKRHVNPLIGDAEANDNYIVSTDNP
jgi:hypothetical protein